jgi:hypothetical protein
MNKFTEQILREIQSRARAGDREAETGLFSIEELYPTSLKQVDTPYNPRHWSPEQEVRGMPVAISNGLLQYAADPNELRPMGYLREDYEELLRLGMLQPPPDVTRLNEGDFGYDLSPEDMQKTQQVSHPRNNQEANSGAMIANTLMRGNIDKQREAHEKKYSTNSPLRASVSG